MCTLSWSYSSFWTSICICRAVVTTMSLQVEHFISDLLTSQRERKEDCSATSPIHISIRITVGRSCFLFHRARQLFLWTVTSRSTLVLERPPRVLTAPRKRSWSSVVHLILCL